MADKVQIMTDAERRELVAFIADLRALEHDDKADLLIKLLDEIERLEKERDEWKQRAIDMVDDWKKHLDERTARLTEKLAW